MKAASDNKASCPARGSFFVFLSLFFLIVFLVLFVFIWETSVQQHYDEHFFREKQLIRNELRMIRREGEPFRYLQSGLNKLYGHLSEEKDISGKKIEELVKNHLGGESTFLGLFFMDMSGEFIDTSFSPTKNRLILSRIGNALKDCEVTGDFSSLAKNRSFFDVFLAGISSRELWKERSALLRVTSGGRPAFFYWNAVHDSKGALRMIMLAHAFQSEVIENMGYQRMLRLSEKKHEGRWKFNIFSSVAEPQSGEGIVGATTAGALSEFRRQNIPEVSLAGHIFVLEPVDADVFIYASNAEIIRTLGVLSFLRNLVLLVFIVFGGRWLFHACVNPDFIGNSGSRVALLCLSAIFPLVGFVSTGYRMIIYHQGSLIEKARERMVGQLESLDDSFSLELKKLRGDYAKLAQDKSAVGSEWPDVAQIIDKMAAEGRVEQIFVFDSKGAPVFIYPQKLKFNELFQRILPPVVRRIFSVNGESGSGWKNRVDEMMFDGIVRNISDFAGDDFSDMFRRLENIDQLNGFTLANKRFFIYSQFIKRDNGAPLLMIAWLGSEAFASSYLEKRVGMQSEHSIPRIKGVPELMIMPEKTSLPPFPIEYTKYSFPVAMRDRILRTGVRQSSVENMAGHDYLIESMILRNIPGYIMFSMLPVEDVLASLHFSIFLFVASIICCLIVVFLAKNMIVIDLKSKND